MNNPTSITCSTRAGIHPLPQEVWAALLWREWRMQRALLSSAAGFFLLLYLVFPIILTGTHAIAATCVLSAILAARLGASDVVENSEGFAFTLPARRTDFFFVRSAFGLGVSLSFLGAGLLVLRWELAPALWGLLVETGLTEADPRLTPYSLSSGVVFVAASFVGPFVAGTLARSRMQASLAWLAGLGLVGVPPWAVLMILQLLEPFPKETLIGRLMLLLLTHTIALASVGWWLYMSKPPASADNREGWSSLPLMVAAAGCVIMIFLLILT